jgi:hypothetical protein
MLKARRLPPRSRVYRCYRRAAGQAGVTVTSVPYVMYGQMNFACAYGSSTQPRLCWYP